MSWRLGACGGFHPKPFTLQRTLLHTVDTVELDSDYSWTGGFKTALFCLGLPNVSAYHLFAIFPPPA